ncbi:MAG: hypothetical protein HC933_13630 [Pleurocapsa sp. SU_196_0]|nr:hypothetical protein [Pleurocapsa sp. SU_196_0]
MRHHRVGYPLVKFNADFLSDIGEHLAFLGLTQNFRRARDVFAKHANLALETKELLAQFDFHTEALTWLLCEVKGGTKTLKLNLPVTHPVHDETRPDALIAWLEGQLEPLAARFDARNGTRVFARKLEASRALAEWMTPYPMGSARAE